MGESQLPHHPAGMIFEAFLVRCQLKRIVDRHFDGVRALEDCASGIVMGALEDCQVRDKLVPVFSCPVIEAGEQDFVNVEYCLVIDWLFFGQIGKRIFDA